MVYIFLGIAGLWGILGISALVTGWGQGAALKTALIHLIMALVNLGVAWYLYGREQRRTGWRR